MIRYILTTLISLMIFSSSAFAQGQTQQSKEKSEVEMHIRKVAKIKTNEIDYAYISAGMFKQMFTIMNVDIKVEDISHPFASIKSLRKFATTGPAGYCILKKHMAPFLQEDDLVMGMNLIALNRENGTLTSIYSDSGNILVVNDDESEMSVVYIIGLTYEMFKAMNKGGISFDF